jgi:CelD/BcsL family acetyltransferase involved in cellulose biosynthesis
MQVEVLRTCQEINVLAANWDGMIQAKRNPLLAYSWFAAAAATLHDESTLHVVVVRRESRVLAIAPMAQTRRHGVDWLEIIGAATLHEPSALLASDESALQSLCESLVSLRRPFMLQRIPVDTCIRSYLTDCARGHGIVITARSAPCLRVEVVDSWEEYLAGRSTQIRTGLRRKRAVLEQLGPVAFESRRPTVAELPEVFEEALNVEEDGWKGASGSSMRRNAPLCNFVYDLARRFATDGALRICFLRAGERAVAMSILLEANQRYWEIKIGYRESAARASPGRLLLWETLREAFGRGLRGYEFLGSGDGQQPDWANASQSLQTLVFYPWNLRGLWALGSDTLGRIVRWLRR